MFLDASLSVVTIRTCIVDSRPESKKKNIGHHSVHSAHFSTLAIVNPSLMSDSTPTPTMGSTTVVPQMSNLQFGSSCFVAAYIIVLFVGGIDVSVP